MKRILILNDTSDHSNWGSLSNIEALKHLLAAAMPDASFSSLYSSWVGRIYRWDPWWFGRRVFNRTSVIADKLSSRYVALPQVADEFDHVSRLWESGKGGAGARDFINHVMDADAVIFNAEGSTYRNNHSALKCLFLLWLARTRYAKPAFFLNGNVTITEVDPILPAMIRKVFPVLDGVAVRVPNALRMVQEAVPDARVELVPDSVFYFSESDCAPASAALEELRAKFSGQPYFCFSLSMLPVDFRRTRKKSALCHVIERLKKQVPHAVLMAKDPEDQFLQEVARDTDSHFFGQHQTFRDVMTLLRDARFLFSGRYHHLIMAADVGCPSIPLISTSPKIQGLCELLGPAMPGPFDPTSLWFESEEIEKEACRILREGDGLRSVIKRGAADCRARVPRLGSIVRDVLISSSSRATPQA